jgi:hypothetical protein
MKANRMSGVKVSHDEVSYQSPSLGIPAHIHVCVTAAGSVILDVKRDRYLGLGRKETELLADSVAGWPEPLWPRSLCLDELTELRATKETCEALVADGVLERILEGWVARAVSAPKDMRGEWISIGDELEIRGRVTLRHVGNFLAAYFWARTSLALRPFCAVVEEIEAAKRCRVRENAARHPHAVAAMVDVFRRLRPFVFAAEGRCLLHALTLMKYLSRYRFYPEWVIGVTTQPWAAHSWVQWGSFLLDSNPEKVCGFTPIMVV